MNQDTITEEQALKASTSSRGRGKGTGKSGRGRGRGDQNNNDGRGRGRNQFDKSKIECYRCHRFGHYRSECYTKLPRDKEKEAISKFVEENEAETLLFKIVRNQNQMFDM